MIQNISVRLYLFTINQYFSFNHILCCYLVKKKKKKKKRIYFIYKENDMFSKSLYKYNNYSAKWLRACAHVFTLHALCVLHRVADRIDLNGTFTVFTYFIPPVSRSMTMWNTFSPEQLVLCIKIKILSDVSVWKYVYYIYLSLKMII